MVAENFEISLSGINITGITSGYIISTWSNVSYSGNTITVVSSDNGFYEVIPPGNWSVITVDFDTSPNNQVCIDNMTFDGMVGSVSPVGLNTCYNLTGNQLDWISDKNQLPLDVSILTSQLAAIVDKNNYYWIGSLTEIDPEKGYIFVNRNDNFYCKICFIVLKVFKIIQLNFRLNKIRFRLN